MPSSGEQAPEAVGDLAAELNGEDEYYVVEDGGYAPVGEPPVGEPPAGDDFGFSDLRDSVDFIPPSDVE